jgi:ferredoxin-NADP reductase
MRDRVADLTRCRVHICGPMPMIREFKSAALGFGVPRQQVKIEAFGADKRAETPALEDR